MKLRAAVARTAAVALGVAALIAALAGGCQRDVMLGGVGGGLAPSSSASGAGQCSAKPCGASCIIDRCQGRSDCTLADLAGYCDTSGRCTRDQPVCEPYVACGAHASCGDPCWPCDLARSDCNPKEQLYTCTDAKNCLPGQATCECVGVECPPPNPCANAMCGTPCSCDPTKSSDCPITTSPTFCDASLKCLPVEAVVCPQGYKPCENQACGEGCSPCGPSSSCPMETTNQTFVCDAYGRCTVAPYTCFKPCTPSSCGEPCQPCVETTPGCMVPDKAFCDRYGSCQVADEPGYCPCQGHACGDTCSFCDPTDPTHCTAKEALANTCDATGACVDGAGGNAPTCPTP